MCPAKSGQQPNYHSRETDIAGSAGGHNDGFARLVFQDFFRLPIRRTVNLVFMDAASRANHRVFQNPRVAIRAPNVVVV
jgi:hypothetical protein